MAVKDKNAAHYIDNKRFFKEISIWKEEWDRNVAEDKPAPRCTEYLGGCFVKISNHLAYKSNFVNYTYRDEMILDGIENCLRYADRFNPEKSNNPFAYFTQITYYSFIRRIKKEAKQAETKLRVLQNIDLHQLLAEIENGGTDNEYLRWVQTQLDVNLKEKAELKKMDNIPKRRPKYFDEKPKLEIPEPTATAKPSEFWESQLFPENNEKVLDN